MTLMKTKFQMLKNRWLTTTMSKLLLDSGASQMLKTHLNESMNSMMRKRRSLSNARISSSIQARALDRLISETATESQVMLKTATWKLSMSSRKHRWVKI